MKRWGSRRHRRVLGALGIALGLGLWQLSAATGSIDVRLFSAPLRIITGVSQLMMTPSFWGDWGLSGLEFAGGFLLALLVGAPLGILMGWNRTLGYLLDPLVMTFYSLPRTALMPIIIVWLGIGLVSKSAVVFLGALFPILVNSAAGLRKADPTLIRAAQSFGASSLDVFRLVLLPSTLPYVMTGVRLGLGRAVIGVITAEMYVATSGLGHRIMLYQTGLNTDMLVAVAFVTAFSGLGLISLARYLERRASHWRVQMEEAR